MAELDNEILEDEEDCDIITLQDDKGEDVDFYHVATIDYNKEWYIFLQPVEAIEGIAEDEVIIYKLGTDADGEDTFIPIESEEELNAVFNEYLKESEEDGCCCGEDGCDCGGESCDCSEDKCSDDCKCGHKD